MALTFVPAFAGVAALITGVTMSFRAPHLRLVTPSSTRTPPRAVTPYDDSELLAAARSGDPRVASALHDRARPAIDRTIARLIGRNDSERDDLAQNALIELITTIDRFRGECSLDSWIATLTARVVYKSIRRRRLERRVFDGSGFAAEYDFVEPSHGAATATLERELVERACKHLSEIEPSRAWAFVLHDVWGYDLRETARIMDVSVTAAQSRLVRGRRDIHARIGDDPELARAIGGEEARR